MIDVLRFLYRKKSLVCRHQPYTDFFLFHGQGYRKIVCVDRLHELASSLQDHFHLICFLMKSNHPGRLYHFHFLSPFDFFSCLIILHSFFSKQPHGYYTT